MWMLKIQLLPESLRDAIISSNNYCIQIDELNKTNGLDYGGIRNIYIEHHICLRFLYVIKSTIKLVNSTKYY